MADEPLVVEARADLDAIEARTNEMETGDVPVANELIQAMTATMGKLRRATDQRAPAWSAEAQRANALMQRIQGIARGEIQGRPPQPDQPTREAAAIMDQVEAAHARQRPGDSAEASRLVNMINAAVARLSASSKRSTALWAETKARVDKLNPAVRERLVAPPGSVPEPPPVDAPPFAGPTPPPAAEQGLGRDDRYTYTTGFQPVWEDYADQLQKAAPGTLANDQRHGQFVSAAQRMRAALAKIGDQGHPWVLDGYSKVEGYLAALERKRAEGQRLVAEAQAQRAAEDQDVDKRLAEIEAFFNPDAFTVKLDAPFTPDRMREWFAQLAQHSEVQAKGLADIERLRKDHPRYDADARVRRLDFWFRERMPKQIARDVASVVDWYEVSGGKAQGALLARVGHADRLVEPGVFTPDRLARDVWVADALKTLVEGKEAALALEIYHAEHRRRPDTQWAQKAAAYDAAIKQLESGATETLKAARMPKTVTTDAALRKIVEEARAARSYPPTEVRRFVINHHRKGLVEEKSESRIEGDMLRIWRWTEEWDEMQACYAEKVDGEWRLVYYSMKILHRGPRWKTVGRWFVYDRIESQRILEENIDE